MDPQHKLCGVGVDSAFNLHDPKPERSVKRRPFIKMLKAEELQWREPSAPQESHLGTLIKKIKPTKESFTLARKTRGGIRRYQSGLPPTEALSWEEKLL